MEHEFKKGDRVVCIPRQYDKNLDWGWELGLEFIVSRISHDSSEASAVLWGGKHGNGVYVLNCKLLINSPLEEVVYKIREEINGK